MERLKERFDVAENALKRLEEVLVIENPSGVERDAAIQRFDFTFETVWKAAKDFLFEFEGIKVGSPKVLSVHAERLGFLIPKRQ